MPAGKLIGIVGPNGAGKITLIKAALVALGRRGLRPWRRCIRIVRIEVEHGISVLDGRPPPGAGSHRVTNAGDGTADYGGAGYRIVFRHYPASITNSLLLPRDRRYV